MLATLYSLALSLRLMSPCQVSPQAIEREITAALCGDENTEDCVPTVDAVLALRSLVCGERTPPWHDYECQDRNDTPDCD